MLPQLTVLFIYFFWNICSLSPVSSICQRRGIVSPNVSPEVSSTFFNSSFFCFFLPASPCLLRDGAGSGTRTVVNPWCPQRYFMWYRAAQINLTWHHKAVPLGAAVFSCSPKTHRSGWLSSDVWMWVRNSVCDRILTRSGCFPGFWSRRTEHCRYRHWKDEWAEHNTSSPRSSSFELGAIEISHVASEQMVQHIKRRIHEPRMQTGSFGVQKRAGTEQILGSKV